MVLVLSQIQSQKLVVNLLRKSLQNSLHDVVSSLARTICSLHYSWSLKEFSVPITKSFF
uniref:Uncharacterized protein n=1 Tax=Arundo donax TaxID=35708 RepID=A0A0A9C2L4_ARUDO